jgi:hypothetical protein
VKVYKGQLWPDKEGQKGSGRLETDRSEMKREDKEGKETDREENRVFVDIEYKFSSFISQDV